MTRSVPRPVRQQWIDFLEDAGASEETARNIAAMIAGDPRLSFIEVDSPEDARDAVETAAFLVEQFDLTELGLTDSQRQHVQEAMLVAHRYGLIEDAPLERLYSDPAAHALAELPTVDGLLLSDDPTIQEMGLSILDDLSDETLGEVVTDHVRSRIAELEDAPATTVAVMAERLTERLYAGALPDPPRARSHDPPSSELLANIRERDESIDRAEDDDEGGTEDLSTDEGESNGEHSVDEGSSD